MSSFTNIFGGITVYPSDLGYVEYTVTQDTTLVWPDLGETSSSVAASFIRASATTTGLDITLPNANWASVGKALRIKNIGSETFEVKTASGSTLLTVSAGQDWLLSITDNTTTGGAWDTSQIGSGTTSAVASVLAGNGLAVSGSTLTVGYPVISFSSTPYAIPISGRANLYVWQGGAGVVTLPNPVTAGDGFLVLLKNQGSGVLTVSAMIDGGVWGPSGVQLNPGGQGALFDSDGTEWKSYGYVNLTTLNLNAAYTKTLTTTSVSLTTTEAQNNIISFAGTLSGDTTVNFPNNVFIYDLTNSTTGAFSLTVQPTLGMGVQIPQGNTRLVTNNASQMYFSDTMPVGTLVQISTGTGLAGGPISTSGTLYLANTTVTSGEYGGTVSGFPIFTVNPQGQLTSAINQPFSGLTMTSLILTGTNVISGVTTITGSVTAPTVSTNNNSTSIATTQFVASKILSISSPTFQTFSSASGTYLTPVSCRAIEIDMVGGGGGGGGTGSGAGAGSNGGLTSFSGLTALGGSGATAVTTNAAGPGASGGSGGSGTVLLRFPGGDGGRGLAVNASFPSVSPGYGGGNMYAPNSAGTGKFPGGGGCGGGGVSSTYGNAGGGGGGEYVKFLIYNPNTSYAYIVGAAGAGGTSGSGGGLRGFTGAGGIVMITEYY